MATEVDPTSVVEIKRYLNYMDEVYDHICVSMSLKILFHVETCTTPNEIWTKLESLFGKKRMIVFNSQMEIT
jgi:hypothetical protein